MLFVMMGGHHSANPVLGQPPQVALQRTPHSGRAGIDQHSVVEDRGKKLAEKNGDDIGRNSAEEQDGELASRKIQATPIGADKREALIKQVAQPGGRDQR